MRSSETYRGARRSIARADATDLGVNFRDLWPSRTRLAPGIVKQGYTGGGKRSKYMPHQGKRECARRMAAQI